MRTIILCSIIASSTLFIVACSKHEDPVPVKGDFKASWTENDNGTTYTCSGSLCKLDKKMMTLYSTPAAGVTRNVTIYFTDTVARSYNVGVSGSGSTWGFLNGINGSDGNVFFNSTSGTFVITQKQPTWISGTFEIKGNATFGPLQKIKGSFEYVNISR